MVYLLHHHNTTNHIERLNRRLFIKRMVFAHLIENRLN